MDVDKILLVEDDLSLIEGLVFSLKKQGFEVDVARTVRESERQFVDGKHDLLLLDLSLPDGFVRRFRLPAGLISIPAALSRC